LNPEQRQHQPQQHQPQKTTTRRGRIEGVWLQSTSTQCQWGIPCCEASRSPSRHGGAWCLGHPKWQGARIHGSPIGIRWPPTLSTNRSTCHAHYTDQGHALLIIQNSRSEHTNYSHRLAATPAQPWACDRSCGKGPRCAVAAVEAAATNTRACRWPAAIEPTHRAGHWAGGTMRSDHANRLTQ
jgi:hypothetical protein